VSSLHKHTLDSMERAVITTDLRGVVTSWNRCAQNLFGWTEEEALGRDIGELTPGDSRRPDTEEILERVKAGDRGDRVQRIHRKDGKELTCRISDAPIMDGDGCIVGLVRVSETANHAPAQETIAQALRDSEAMVRGIVSSVPDAVLMIDPDMTVTWMNDRAKAAFGDAVGCRCYHVLHSAQSEVCPGCPARRTFGDGAIHDHEIEIPSPDGATRHFWTTTSVAAEDENGTPRLVVAVVRDVTEREAARHERARLEEQYLQAQKMESVGRLAGGVAHDFNNMLTAILGYSDLALQRVSQSDPIRQDLEAIRKSASRSAELTRQLLAFARKQTISPRVLDLNETVEGMLNMLRRLIGEDITLEWLPAASVWPVRVDPGQFDQVVANLCVNARDAMSDGGTLSISTANARHDTRFCVSHPGYIAGDFVMVEIRDDGCGMDGETLERIYEPFYTTKEVGAGTGLGLSTVYGIVTQSDGFIDVESTPGDGTTFRIFFPRHLSSEVAPDRKTSEPALERGSETILLVEDEPLALDATSKMLRHLGYAVLEAGSAEDAIRIADTDCESVDLVLSDVVMPRMTGKDLVEYIVSRHPNVRPVFMSGYPADVIAHQGVLDEGVEFISKPISLPELARLLRRVLDRA